MIATFIFQAASYGTFLAASVNLPLGSKAWMEVRTGFTSRRLLQVLSWLILTQIQKKLAHATAIYLNH